VSRKRLSVCGRFIDFTDATTAMKTAAEGDFKPIGILLVYDSREAAKSMTTADPVILELNDEGHVYIPQW